MYVTILVNFVFRLKLLIKVKIKYSNIVSVLNDKILIIINIYVSKNNWQWCTPLQCLELNIGLLQKMQTYNFLILWLNQSIQNLQFVKNDTFCPGKNTKKCVFHLLK